MTMVLRGAQAVGRQAFTSARLSPFVRPALVNGSPGVVVAAPRRGPVRDGLHRRDEKVVAIDVLADPERLRRLDVSALDDER
ncbi:MAG: hypothetical protein M3237_23205 [Actinomycetota bacterium]|nr:hypothetical protein [Actinomycetota bacterium]